MTAVVLATCLLDGGVSKGSRQTVPKAMAKIVQTMFAEILRFKGLRTAALNIAKKPYTIFHKRIMKCLQ